MTRAGVSSLIHAAEGALGAGDCASAQAALAQAWDALGAYSAGLAASGAATGTAISLHKSITKVQNMISRRCPRDPDALAPVYYPPGGRRDPDALAPMHGTGDVIFDSLTTTLTTLGILGAVFGLGYGFYVTYKGKAT